MVRRLAGGGAGLCGDTCLLEEADVERFLELGRTKDGAYVTVNSNSKTSSEVRAPQGLAQCGMGGNFKLVKPPDLRIQ